MFTPTIGLEIHMELRTRSKMFCGCPNIEGPEPGRETESRPNANTCPICLGHPGVLPTANKEAIAAVLKLALATGAVPAAQAKFDRKSYFYPDLPKNYQISQYDEPIALGGSVNGVRIRRIHLEEDTGRLLHGEKGSLIDFNRAGVPLMELVTEPDIHDAETAVSFAKELQRICRYLGIARGDLEKGEMRVEANISVSEGGTLGTKVEVKNLNSFKAVGEAIAYEISRQEELVGRGEQVVQETRGWDERKRMTVSQRRKEEAHDYRYIPEPDIPPLDLADVSVFDLEELRRSLPELPSEKRARFQTEYGLAREQSDILIDEPSLAAFFEQTVSELGEETDKREEGIRLIWNYLVSDIKGILNEQGADMGELKIKPVHLAHLAAMLAKKEISSRMAKDILRVMFEAGLDPHEIVAQEKIEQITDEARIAEVAREVIAGNAQSVGDYRRGKTNALQFLVGQAMKKLSGKGSPELIRKCLEEALAFTSTPGIGEFDTGKKTS